MIEIGANLTMILLVIAPLTIVGVTVAVLFWIGNRTGF
jgi:hypothetical protein